jgi:transaldolase
VKSVDQLKVKIFADGADLATMITLSNEDYISGLTTNPTLMHKSGIADYKAFALEVLAEIRTKPISFEVFSDNFAEMEKQALQIAEWGENVYVKIPITNTKGESSGATVKSLSSKGVKLNVTAIMTPEQVNNILNYLDPNVASYISVFAGRVADTGRDPIEGMVRSLKMMESHKLSELIWASPRELLNIIQADDIGCHIITVTHDILKKMSQIGKDLDEFSLETVKMFYDDAAKAGFELVF